MVVALCLIVSRPAVANATIEQIVVALQVCTVSARPLCRDCGKGRILRVVRLDVGDERFVVGTADDSVGPDAVEPIATRAASEDQGTSSNAHGGIEVGRRE